MDFDDVLNKTPIEKTKEMPFKAWKREQTEGQTFGRPKIVKCGKEIDMHDLIQEARTDTEIYPTLEKYGCLDRLELDAEGVYGDFTAMKDLRGLIEQAQAADVMWNNLPKDVRAHFENNKALFVEGGEKYLKDIIDSKKQLEKVEQGTPEIKENIENAQ